MQVVVLQVSTPMFQVFTREPPVLRVSVRVGLGRCCVQADSLLRRQMSLLRPFVTSRILMVELRSFATEATIGLSKGSGKRTRKNDRSRSRTCPGATGAWRVHGRRVVVKVGRPHRSAGGTYFV